MKSQLDFIKSITFDYSLKTGVTFLVDILVKESTGIVTNLTGFTAVLSVYDGLTKILDIIGSISEPLTGKIRFQLSATATTSLPVGKYIYHLETTAGAIVTRLAEGKFEIRD